MDLRSFIKEAIRAEPGSINEAKYHPEDIPDDYAVFISKFIDGIRIQIRHKEKKNEELGWIMIAPARPRLDGGDCDGAFVVQASLAKKGWGPMLYDLAIEWASINGEGLTPDRDTVSDAAFSVWKRYMSRSDVKKHKLSKGSCRMASAEDHKKTFQRSPMNYRFTKMSDTFDQLKSINKLVMES